MRHTQNEGHGAVVDEDGLGDVDKVDEFQPVERLGAISSRRTLGHFA